MLAIDRSGTSRRGRPYAPACTSLLACAVAFPTPQHPPETSPNPAQIGGLFLIVILISEERGYPAPLSARPRAGGVVLTTRQRIILYGRDGRLPFVLFCLPLPNVHGLVLAHYKFVSQHLNASPTCFTHSLGSAHSKFVSQHFIAGPAWFTHSDHEIQHVIAQSSAIRFTSSSREFRDESIIDSFQ